MILTVLALAMPTKALIYWDPSQAPVPTDLPTAMGSGYAVRTASVPGMSFADATKRVPLARNSGAKVVFLMLGSAEESPQVWRRQKDSLVPTISSLVAGIRAWPSHPKVILGVVSQRTSLVTSLVRQAARETGTPIVSVSKEDVTGDLYEALVNPRLAKASWRVVSVDSEQADEGPAKAAIDGNPETYWHTRYEPKLDRPPHELVVDMGKAQTIGGFRYLPRQDGGVNGRVKGYALYLSLDGKDWRLASEGTLPDTLESTRVRFEPVRARFFRFVAKSEAHNGPWTSAAEIDVVLSR